MIRSLIAILTLTILTLTYSPSTAQNEEWTKPYEPFRIAGNLYYVGTYDLACYLITTTDGNILINTGLAESAPMIKKSIETLGFKYSDIKILLTTQAHFDHVAGMAKIKNDTGAKMMVDEGDAKLISNGGKGDFAFGDASPYAPVTVDRVLHDKDIITLGDMKVTILHHPGHTRGSCSFILDVKDDQKTWKVLIANIPSILPSYKLTGMPSYPNIGKDYVYTLEAMKALKFDLWVASHASQFDMHEKRKVGQAYNPESFSDKQGYDVAIDKIKEEYTERLRKEKAN